MADNTEANTQEEVVGADSTAQYTPVVVLKTIETRTGEEDEDTIFEQRSRLYRFADETQEWRERGTGTLKILKHKTTNVCRLLLRQDKTGHLRLNHTVQPAIEMKEQFSSDRAWQWVMEDLTESPPIVAPMCLKFRNAQIANEFKAKYDECRETNEVALANVSPEDAQEIKEEDVNVPEVADEQPATNTFGSPTTNAQDAKSPPLFGASGGDSGGAFALFGGDNAENPFGANVKFGDAFGSGAENSNLFAEYQGAGTPGGDDSSNNNPFGGFGDTSFGGASTGGLFSGFGAADNNNDEAPAEEPEAETAAEPSNDFAPANTSGFAAFSNTFTAETKIEQKASPAPEKKRSGKPPTNVWLKIVNAKKYGVLPYEEVKALWGSDTKLNKQGTEDVCKKVMHAVIEKLPIRNKAPVTSKIDSTIEEMSDHVFDELQKADSDTISLEEFSVVDAIKKLSALTL